MAISKLPMISEYWRKDNLIGNDGIQNAMIQNRFYEILQQKGRQNRQGFQDETSDRPPKFEVFSGAIE